MFQSFIDQVWNQIFNQQNQFLQGGLVLGFIGGVIAYFRNLPSKMWNWFLYYGTITLDVKSTDQVYNKLLYWLNTQKYSKKTRRLSLKGIFTPEGHRVILLPDHGRHYFWWRKRFVWLNRFEEESKNGGGTASVMSMMAPRETIEIRMIGRSQKIVQELVDEALSFFKEDKKWVFTIHLKDYNWESQEVEKPRPLSTVFLPDTAEGIVDDMKRFLANREWYKERGIPYRRGYLFYGPPGTGKSCSAAALAAHLKMHLYVLNLATLGSDGSIQDTLGNLHPPETAMLLIEDIDTAMPKREQNKETKTADFSLGSLLNALDGVNACENLIVVMTTNKRESLDAALIRPGRVDRQIEFGPASDNQLEAAAKVFFPTCYEPILAQMKHWERPISMASVQDKLIALSLEAKEIEDAKTPIPADLPITVVGNSSDVRSVHHETAQDLSNNKYRYQGRSPVRARGSAGVSVPS